MAKKIVVGKREMMIAKETTISAERGGVWRRKHQVTLSVDESPLALGIATPQDKHKMVAVIG